MPRKYSDYFGIDKKILAQFDVLDGYVDIDSHFYIDPSLLDSLKIPEFINAKKIFDEKFIEIKELLARSKMPNREDVEFAKACKLLELNEINMIKLGYSNNNYGRGIGEKIALNICKNLYEIIKNNPTSNANILDYICVFQKGFGADFVSDMTANIIKNCFIDYTSNIINTIALDKKYIKVLSDGRSILSKDEDIYFVPKKILTALPIINQFFNVADLIDHNENLRRKIDKMVIDAICEKTSRSQKKGIIKGLLINNLSDILIIYNFFKKECYDFDLDPMNLLIWQKIADKYNLDHIKQNGIMHLTNLLFSLYINHEPDRTWKHDRRASQRVSGKHYLG